MAIDPNLLADVPMFQLFDADEMRDLASQLDEQTYSAGQTIIRGAGDQGGQMHVVLAGKVEIEVRDDSGHRVVVATVEPGEIFGELSLLDNEPRSATAVAVVTSKTCLVDREDLSYLFTRRPAAALDILAVLGRRIRQTDEVLRHRDSRNANLVIEESTRLPDRIADGVARFGGSWSFINSFGVVILVWIVLNTWWFATPFDPPPYIGLNLILSLLAAMQAPVIMMSQNRQDAKDRVRSELDYQVNVRAELEILQLEQKIDRMHDALLERLDALGKR